MKPLGLVDVPNKVSDLELPFAKGANTDDVSLGTPPTNSCACGELLNIGDRRTSHTNLHQLIPHAAHGRPQLHHLQSIQTLTRLGSQILQPYLLLRSADIGQRDAGHTKHTGPVPTVVRYDLQLNSRLIRKSC